VNPSVDYVDGEWHRLHPATPFLRGGFTFVAIVGFAIANFRDTLLSGFFGTPNEEDPIGFIYEHDLIALALAMVLGVLLLVILGFYISWRVHTFRITDEVVEVRSGLIFRTNRKARLDRIQGVNVARPFFARLFGAAKLEISVAGQDANVQLSYLTSGAADHVRVEVLRLASGTAKAGLQSADATDKSIIEKRVSELLAPELDTVISSPQSIVNLHIGRLIGSLLLSNTTVGVIVIAGVLVTGTVVADSPYVAFAILPMLLGAATFYWSRFVRSLRYSIASTPDGIRIGWGLFSTTNETLPPGRVHAVELSQPLLWRIAGWWELKVTLASKSSASGAAGQANTTLLPVGSADDVQRVLRLVYPQFDNEAMTALLVNGFGRKKDGDGYTTSPRRGAILRWFSWRRNGFATGEGLVLLRTGAVWRRLAIVPLARLQSVAIERGPLRNRLRLASVRLHLVTGPVATVIGAIDLADARAFFGHVASEAVLRGSSDLSQRWRSHETA
jgi:putative membrane protein